jgi:hypothetical protein
MLWVVAFLAFLVWAMAFCFFHVAAGLIHLALVPALLAAIYDLITDRRRVT